jgi:ABC-2 type transport system ATP-binding protein
MVDGSLEIELDKSQGLNAVFQQLTQQGVSVRSMRNKANRLEELFVTIVRDSNRGDN